MPVISHFYGILIYMYAELGGHHNEPHIHVKYNEYEMSITIKGEKNKDNHENAKSLKENNLNLNLNKKINNEKINENISSLDKNKYYQKSKRN